MSPVSTAGKLPRDAYAESVQVKIGQHPNAKVFTIHKDVLTHYSGYFEGALRHTSTFTEARDGIFWLPDEEIDTWERFVFFLYREELDLTGLPSSSTDSSDCLLQVLCRLWVLADRREVPLLMNKCIDRIKARVFVCQSRTVQMLPYVYANTAPGSALRRFILCLSARVGDAAKISPFGPSISQYLDEESSRDLLELVWNIKGNRTWNGDQLNGYELCSEYHTHGPGEERGCEQRW